MRPSDVWMVLKSKITRRQITLSHTRVLMVGWIAVSDCSHRLCLNVPMTEVLWGRRVLVPQWSGQCTCA